MRVFTFSPIVSPTCESSWERFVLCPGRLLSLLSASHSPSCQALLPAKPLFLVYRPSPWGSLSATGPAAPPHVLHCSHPPVSPAFVVICLFWGRWGAGGGFGFVPFHSASELGAGPGFTGPISLLRSQPQRENVLLASDSSSSGPFILPGLLWMSSPCCLQGHSQLFRSFLLMSVSRFRHFENHHHNAFHALWHTFCACSDVLILVYSNTLHSQSIAIKSPLTPCESIQVCGHFSS